MEVAERRELKNEDTKNVFVPPQNLAIPPTLSFTSLLLKSPRRARVLPVVGPRGSIVAVSQTKPHIFEIQ